MFLDLRMPKIIYYNSNLKKLSRELRNKSTLSEVLLWDVIKGKKIKGYQFSRQKPIGNYIVDFYCSKLKLVIEIDGNSHDSEAYKNDLVRTDYLISQGLRVLRFSDLDIKKDLNGIIGFLEDWIANN